MSKRKNVNLTKIKSKIDDIKQNTISKFFAPNSNKNTKQHSREDEAIIIDDGNSPTKSEVKNLSPTWAKKRIREEELPESNFSKKKCLNSEEHINSNNESEISGKQQDSCSSSSEISGRLQDGCSSSLEISGRQQAGCSSSSEISGRLQAVCSASCSISTQSKLKQFELDTNREKTEIHIQQLKKSVCVSIDNDSSEEDKRCISDSDEDILVQNTDRLSGFSHPSHTASTGKSPINRKTKSKYTPLEQQFVDIKEKYPNALLLMECGYKYRFFGEDAEIAAKVLKIFCHLDHNFMTASIPTHRLFVHVRRLVSAGYKVGVVKQMETAAIKAAGDNRNTPFTRQLQSLYTKSTLIGEDVNPISSDYTEGVDVEEPTSFLLCVCDTPPDHTKQTSIGILAVQPSTGDIIYDCFNDNDTRSELETRITHIQPAEILVPCNLSSKTEKMINGIIDISKREDDRIRLEKLSEKYFLDAFKIVSEFYQSDVKCGDRLQEVINLPKPVVSCLSAVITYLKDFNLSQILKLTGNFCQFSTKSIYMQLQSNVLRNLEIFQNLTDGKEKGSLFWAINHTSTKFGARMLKSWIKRPLLSAKQILARQEAVNEMLEGPNSQTLGQLRSSLAQTPDLEKGISSIYYKKCSVLEFFLVCKSLVSWSDNVQLLCKQLDGKLSSNILIEILNEIPELLADIKTLLNNIQENNVRDKDKTSLFSDESLFPSVQQRKKEIDDVEKEMYEHRRTIRLTLKQPALNYVTVQGTEYLVEVKNNILHVVPSDWIKISSTKAVSRFHPPFVVATYKRLNQLREQLKKDCDEAWLQFLSWFEDDYQKYRKAVQHIATLDCLLSLSSVARLHGFCRPKLNENEVCINIVQGRHPVIHQILRENQQFVPNDTCLSTKGQKVMVITGPNMGGKSSYIKQVALLTVLTQIGSYVPAESAEMGIVDAIYTRMGASDEIYKGRSTFMVELMEASDIIAKATSHSLVILDELGRGTSTHDGVAIACATLDYFIKQVQCLTLFVTHYPVLSEFEQHYPGQVQNYHMSFIVNDQTGYNDTAVTFLYQLVLGKASKSYGLNVARLASIPAEILKKAADKSEQFEDIVAVKRERKELFEKICSAEDPKLVLHTIKTFIDAMP